MDAARLRMLFTTGDPLGVGSTPLEEGGTKRLPNARCCCRHEKRDGEVTDQEVRNA